MRLGVDLARVGARVERWAHRWVPDPFVFAVVLTFVTLLAGFVLTDAGPLELAGFWQAGFFDLLGFGMQMVLILVTGHALATSPPVHRGIQRLAGVPRTGPGAAAFVAVVAMGAALLNWGFGLIVGALLAREVAWSLESRGERVHYPLLGAAGYMGLLVWHGGLSGSAPLKVAESGASLASTIGSPLNLTVNAALLVVVPLFLHRLHPRDPSTCLAVGSVAPRVPSPADANGGEGGPTFAGGLEGSRVLVVLLVLLAAAGLWAAVASGRLTLERLALNDVIFVFLFLGLALHGSLRSYLRQVWEGARASAGIILLFPFYAGITGIMQSSGLVSVVSDAFARVSDSVTYPLFTFLSAGVVNLFVPSGGGQWAVQGPIATQAATEIGVPFSKTVMAVSYGDEWTNMLQPFWALALLGITGLKARHVLGYTILVLFVSAIVFSCALLVF